MTWFLESELWDVCIYSKLTMCCLFPIQSGRLGDIFYKNSNKLLQSKWVVLKVGSGDGLIWVFEILHSNAKIHDCIIGTTEFNLVAL